jgi:hypothetical protein
MTTATVRVIGGVDTHGHSHHPAVIDGVGRQLDDREFPASPAGYAALLEWLRGYGELDRVGFEGTGTSGVALTRHLCEGVGPRRRRRGGGVRSSGAGGARRFVNRWRTYSRATGTASWMTRSGIAKPSLSTCATCHIRSVIEQRLQRLCTDRIDFLHQYSPSVMIFGDKVDQLFDHGKQWAF